MKESLWAGPPGEPEAKYLMGDPYHSCELAGTHFLPNLWPEKPRDLRPILEEHFRTMRQFGFDLHRLFCIALGLPENYFYEFIDKPFTSFRAVHYPKLENEPELGQVRAGDHRSKIMAHGIEALTEHAPGSQIVPELKPIDGEYIVRLEIRDR